MTFTKKQITLLKKEVKKATGKNMKDIEDIKAFGKDPDPNSEKDFILYGYYDSNYDRVTSKITYHTILIDKIPSEVWE